jgi:hypothetical protein
MPQGGWTDCLHAWSTLAAMKLLLFFFVVLLLIGGAIKLAGQQLPILDYPLGGPMGQPKIEIVQPHLNMP